MGTRNSKIAYTKIETVSYRAEYTEATTIRIPATEHRLPPGTSFLYQLFLANGQQTDGRRVGSNDRLQYGWDDSTIVFTLPHPFTGMLILTAILETPVSLDMIARLPDGT